MRFLVVLSAKLLLFDVDDGTDMDHHPLHHGRLYALLWTLLNPIICACVAILGSACGVMVSSLVCKNAVECCRNGMGLPRQQQPIQ